MAIAEEKGETLKISVSDSENTEEVETSDEDESHNNENSSEGDVSDEIDEEDTVIMKNEGWANSIAKILSSSKPKNKKTMVLSRAKKHADVQKKANEEVPSFEIVGEKSSSSNEKPEVKDLKPAEKKEEPPAKKKKLDRPSIKVKPNILEKDRERLLSKVATKGVVQLFNAVRNQQKTLEKELSSDVSEGKKEKVMKKFDKRAFLDSLMGQSKSVIVDETTKTEAVKDEVILEETPRWNALRDDFMMGAKMKDWDKEPVDE